jgi:cytochrome b subunit of formate dehydrogenase
MRTGRVSATWARAQHGAWVDELDQPRAEPEDDDATTTA